MAGDLKRFFDVGRLDEQQLGMIEFVLNSPAYTDSFKPYLLSIRDNMNDLWLDRSQKRKDMFPDDYLAGMIAAIDGLLKLFTILIHETSVERIHSAMSNASSDQQYDQYVKDGRNQPVVGINQNAVPDRFEPTEFD
jgi:hypothetical protein